MIKQAVIAAWLGTLLFFVGWLVGDLNYGRWLRNWIREHKQMGHQVTILDDGTIRATWEGEGVTAR